MALNVRPEIEVRVQQKLMEGYRDVDQLIESALDRLDEANCGMTLAEVRAKIDEGWAAAERGDTISAEDFEAKVDAKL